MLLSLTKSSTRKLFDQPQDIDMTKLSSAFGDTINIRTKTFDLAGHKFKVRVPLTKELEDLNKRIQEVPEDALKERYEKAISGLSKDTTTEGIEFKEDDVVIDGRSTKELIRTAIQIENRVVEFIRLLIPVDGDLSQITYAEIDEEWPFAIQVEMLEKIGEAIQPGYKDSRKN